MRQLRMAIAATTLVGATTAQADVLFTLDLNDGSLTMTSDTAMNVDSYEFTLIDTTKGDFDVTKFETTLGPNKFGPFFFNSISNQDKVAEVSLTVQLIPIPAGLTALGEAGLFMPSVPFGQISAADFRAKVGGTSDGVAINVIPEPASLALLALGGVAMIARRRSA